MTISEKLQSIKNTKTSIKNAIINKGVTISDNDAFASYPDKINEISTSGDSTVALPTQINGLVLCLDGDCNTRNGLDYSNLYMENLVYLKPAGANFSQSETIKSGGEWKDNFLALGNYSFYPKFAESSSNFAVEYVFKINKEVDSTGLVLNHCLSAGGWACTIQSGNNVRFSANDGGNVHLVSNFVLELNRPYYMVCTLESGSQLSIKINNLSQETTPFGTYTKSSNAIATGFGCNASQSSSSTARYDGLEVGMIKWWNRALNGDEILQHYQDAKTRFGVEDLTLDSNDGGWSGRV